jgi:DNA-binding beta-propeller fold protein YncE
MRFRGRRPWVGATMVGFVLVAVGALGTPLSSAAPGDVYVADAGSFEGGAYRVNPTTGEAIRVYTAPGEDDQPADVAFSLDGRLLLLDQDAPGAPNFPGTLFGIDLATGAATPIVGGEPWGTPHGVVVGPNGEALVADEDSEGSDDAAFGAVFHVDPSTGARTKVPASPLLEEPSDVAVTPAGEVYVTDPQTGPTGGVFRVDLTSGTATPIVAGPQSERPRSLAAAPDGSLLVLLAGQTDAVWRVSPASGAVQTVFSGPPLGTPEHIALAPDGTIYVVDPATEPDFDAAVLRLSPTTGAMTPLHVGAPFGFPQGVVVEPPTCAGLTATVVGSMGPDRIFASPGADVIATLDGKDRINGSAGKDVICGGTAKDRIKGGKGNDRLFGEAGRDRLVGGKGKKDRCVGGKGRDRGAGSCEKGKI